MRSPLDSPVEVAFAIYLQTLKLSMYAIKTVTNDHTSSISQRKSVNGALADCFYQKLHPQTQLIAIGTVCDP
jgi:hypothetical protein